VPDAPAIRRKKGGIVRSIVRHSSVLSFVTASSLTWAAAAVAQTPQGSDTALSEIIVTAQRREERLQDVPIAVTAFDASTIDRDQVTTIQNVASFVPNLWMETNTGLNSGSRAALRGIGEDESFFTSDPPVGIYVDDVYIPRQTGALFDLYDIERIEVLRGPQGTLYGRNTSGGAIKLVSRKPDATTRASLEVGVGDYSRRDVKASLAGALSEQLMGQIAFLSRDRDGYDRNLVNGTRVNDQDVAAGRASLRWRPSEAADFLLTYDQLRDRSTPGYAVGVKLQPPNDLGAWQADQQYDGDTDVHTLKSDLTSPINDLDMHGIALTAEFQIGGATLKSITAWRDLKNELLLDADGQDTCFGLALPCLHLYQNQSQHQLSEELQLSGKAGGDRLDYVLGVYGFKESNSQRTENVILAFLGENPYTDTSLDTRSVAAYASGTWRFTPKLAATVGLRWTRDQKKFESAVFDPDGSAQLVCAASSALVVYSSGACTAASPAGSRTAPLARTIDQTWSAVTPRFAIDYTVRDGLMAYGSVSKGFKSGAFDGRESSTLLYSLQPIAPEKVLAYEIGTKADWLDKRLRTNVALFVNEIDDLQGTGTNQATGTFTRFSVGDVETKGAELELTAVPAKGLEIAASVGLLDTRYTKVNFDQATDCGPVGTATKALEMKFAPHVATNLSVNYSFAAFLGGEMTVGGNWTRKSSFYHSSCNPLPSKEDGYDLVDAQLAWQSADERWRVALAMKNITNEDYATGQFFIPGLGFDAIYFNPPRTWTLTARYSLR